MLTSLPELVQRCAGGDEGVQKALLDEVEPLLFGYLRSLGAPFERAVRLAHASLLGFALDLRAGRVRLADANALRAACHRIAAAKLADPAPWLVRHEGDPETGALAPVALPLAARIEAALDAESCRVAARRLQGGPGDPGDAVFKALFTTGVPERDA